MKISLQKTWQLTAIVGLFALSGCATTLSPQIQENLSGTIAAALNNPAEELRARADAGDGHAQLALSIVLEYGLNGTPVDHQASATYRAKATAVRGYTTSAIYVPGYAKVPGHTQLINLPQTDVSSPEANAVYGCAALLATKASPAQAKAELESGICGGVDNYVRLSALWAQATLQK